MEDRTRPRIAVIGTGIAGLSCAWKLRDVAELTLFEGDQRPGGHTNTVTVEEDGRGLPIDTGFIVFNKVTYPNLCGLFGELGIEGKPSEMSLSVQHLPTGLEYNGMGFNKLFAQRRNLLSPRFLSLIAEIMRFFRIGRRWLAEESEGSLGDADEEAEEDLLTFCKRHRFGPDFIELYLIPMSSAVWSTEPGRILDFPAATLLHFFHNHGFLGITTHHPWFTVKGGARTYLGKMLGILGAPRLSDPVVSVVEDESGASIVTASGVRERFDAVVLAAHADQSQTMLGNHATEEQKRLLSPFKYQQNETLLHTDASVMPRKRLAWASWNFRVDQPDTGHQVSIGDRHHHRHASTHYWMNALQGVSEKRDYFVSLNSTDLIDPKSVLYSTTYEHPVFTLEAIRAQRELPRLNHGGRLFFCGSYFRYGFHEDACMSGFDAAKSVADMLAQRR